MAGHTLTNSFCNRTSREKNPFYHLPHLLNTQEMPGMTVTFNKDAVWFLAACSTIKNEVTERSDHLPHQSGAAGVNGPDVCKSPNSPASNRTALENKSKPSPEHWGLPTQKCLPKVPVEPLEWFFLMYCQISSSCHFKTWDLLSLKL